MCSLKVYTTKFIAGIQAVISILRVISISFSRHTPPPMIFGRRPMSPLAQRIRKSGHIYPLSAISMESVDNLGRRRSLSLDDLGIKTSSNQFNHNDLTSPPSLSIASNLGSPTIIDDTDDELDDLPLEEISGK